MEERIESLMDISKVLSGEKFRELDNPNKEYTMKGIGKNPINGYQEGYSTVDSIWFPKKIIVWRITYESIVPDELKNIKINHHHH